MSCFNSHNRHHLNSQSRLYRTYIDGIRLVFSMNPAPASVPILLYLHGGPGASCIPLTTYYNAELEKDFRFINLDQPGSGLSYYPFTRNDQISIDSMVEHIHRFVQALLTVYRQKSLVLIGHSWGSVLGLEMVRRYPELISQYIGLGQVVNMKQALLIRSQHVARSLPAWVQKIVRRESSTADAIMMVYEAASRRGLTGFIKQLDRVRVYMHSPYYPWRTLVPYILGQLQSVERLNDELEQVNFDGQTSFGVPVTFISGRYDWTLPTKLVEEFATSLKSSARMVIFQNSGHCPQWDEADHFNKLAREICLDENKEKHNLK